ncbi:MAG TPA: NAD(P)/FAD-dependent oxidoreductase, partial [Phenylobacterium sp.]
LGLALATPAERAGAVAAAAPMICKWGGQTLESFARRFRDPFLRRAFPTIIYDWPKQSMLMALYFMGRASVGDLGWPKGGAQALSQAIADRFVALGGEIRYGARVQSILVERGRAVGVRMCDGAEYRADIVISNAYGPETIFGMLGGRYTTRAIRAYYGAPEDRYEMGLHVSLGVARDLSGEPHAIVLPLDPPVVIGGELRERLYVEPFGFDPTLAPAGKSVLKVVLPTSYSQWERLAGAHEAYKHEQAQIAEAVIAQLERRFPGLRAQIEVIDVATPLTTKRFTGNGHGFKASMNGLLLALLAGKRLSQTLPGLANFYMVGQWAGIPGVPMVAAMGRDVVRQICRRDGRRFHTEVAAISAPSPRQAA